MADDETTEHETDETQGGEGQGENLGAVVGREVRRVLGELLGDGEVDVVEGGEDEGSTTSAAEPSSPRQVEADMESKVREALKSITAEEEHQREHEKLKKEVEKPPQLVSRVTRFLWGEP